MSSCCWLERINALFLARFNDTSISCSSSSGTVLAAAAACRRTSPSSSDDEDEEFFDDEEEDVCSSPISSLLCLAHVSPLEASWDFLRLLWTFSSVAGQVWPLQCLGEKWFSCPTVSSFISSNIPGLDRGSTVALPGLSVATPAWTVATPAYTGITPWSSGALPGCSGWHRGIPWLCRDIPWLCRDIPGVHLSSSGAASASSLAIPWLLRGYTVAIPG